MNRRTFIAGLMATTATPALSMKTPAAYEWTTVTKTFRAPVDYPEELQRLTNQLINQNRLVIAESVRKAVLFGEAYVSWEGETALLADPRVNHEAVARPRPRV